MEIFRTRLGWPKNFSRLRHVNVKLIRYKNFSSTEPPYIKYQTNIQTLVDIYLRLSYLYFTRKFSKNKKDILINSTPQWFHNSHIHLSLHIYCTLNLSQSSCVHVTQYISQNVSGTNAKKKFFCTTNDKCTNNTLKKSYN